jgi:ubiquinone/menaquinone biosynthesis C-methylase UbiE
MDSAAFWDKRSKQYDDAIGKHDAPFDKTIERARALLGSSDVLLDFGCGTGEFSVELAPYVQQIRGIDTSAGMIDLAKKKAQNRRTDNVIFDQKDLFDHSLASRTFSSALAFSVLHLVDDMPAVLARLNGLLEPNGLLISETPCLGEKNWLFRSSIGLAQRLRLLPRICSITGDELESLVSGNGFEILESEIWDDQHSTRWIVARKS